MLHKAIAKNLKVKAKGVYGGINYLMGYKWRMVKPELLRGNIDITRQILAQEKNSNAYTHGVLSFEENALDVPQSAQDFAMNLFEETLMAGFPVNHYDIVWIRHTDKDFDAERDCGRLELNYHIINRDLVTDKVITPYLHKRDMLRINLAKQIINDKFNLSSPDDPAHYRQINLADYGSEYKGVAKQLTEFILEGIATERISNRGDIIEALKLHSGIESVRGNQPDTYLVVKLKGAKQNLRLKGTLYEKHQFTSVTDLIERQASDARGYHLQRDKRIKQNIEKLRALNYQITQQRAQLMQAKRKRGRKPTSSTAASDSKKQSSIDFTQQKYAISKHQTDSLQPTSRRENQKSSEAGSSIGVMGEYQARQNSSGHRHFDSSGFSIGNRRNLPFRGLDFSASLETKLMFGKKFTRSQRQWYAVYKKGIAQDVVCDAIILDKGGFGANRTIVSQRLNTVIREYDELFTVSICSSPEAKKLGYLLTIEAAVAKGWNVTSLRLTTNIEESSATEQATFDAAILQYYKNKGLTPSKDIIQKHHYGRQSNNTTKPVSASTCRIREETPAEQPQSNAIGTEQSAKYTVDDAVLGRFCDQARAMAAKADAIESQHSNALKAISSASRNHQQPLSSIREREEHSAELARGYEQLSDQWKQLTECCERAAEHVRRVKRLDCQSKVASKPYLHYGDKLQFHQ
ncbi:hypothetical protein [Shewanella sp. 125m-1]